MKYQIRNSTVSFTNRSVQTGDVSSWEWLMDSGSGFVSLGNTPDIDITFPDVAGQLCIVRLVASGAWGSDVVKEEQYTTVEDVPPPVAVVPPTQMVASGEYVEFYPEIQVGTGAGDISWEVYGGGIGFAVDPDSGKVFGLCKGSGTQNLSLRATDALGRSTILDVVFSITRMPGEWYDLQDPTSIVLDGGKIAGLVSQQEETDGSRLSITIPTAAEQPDYVADVGDGFACAHFSELTHSILFNSTSVRALWIMVVDFPENNLGSLTQILGQDTTYEIAGMRLGNQRINTGGTSNQNLAMPFPRGRCILTQHMHHTSGTARYYYLNEDGVRRGGTSSYGGVGVFPTMNRVGARGGFPAAEMRVYEMIALQTWSTVERANSLLQRLGEKYNIPVKLLDVVSGG